MEKSLELSEVHILCMLMNIPVINDIERTRSIYTKI